MIKAVCCTRHGAPEDAVSIVDLSEQSPGPGEVRVAMEAAAVHLKELYIIEGIHGFDLPLPLIPGNSAVGRVLDAGESVHAFQPGQRVWVLYREPWIEGSGTWREIFNVPAARLYPAPEHVAAEQLAFVCNNLLSACLLLRDTVSLKEGDWFIQNAANSNCGQYLIQLGNMWGLQSVNVVRRESAIDEVSGWGGNVVLVDGDDLAERVAEKTGNAPVSVGFDAVAGMATDRIASCVQEGGTVVNYGIAGGQPCCITPAQFLLRDIRVRGFLMDRSFFAKTHGERHAVFAELGGLVAAGGLQSRIAGLYPLERVTEALAHQARTGAERPGKICLKSAI